ncbi:hypothetical protein M9Y10_036408, partial [Tritrichomonas musculus]
MQYRLHVKVVEADNIPKMDANATDAYCVLSAGGETCTTFAIMNTMHPKWGQDFHFNVSSPTSGELRIKMRDKDKFKDDDISTIEILYSSLPVGQLIDQWYDMVPCKRVKKGGKLHLILHMARAIFPPFIPDANLRAAAAALDAAAYGGPVSYQLHVKVVEADNIPKMDANATDAYCVLSTSSETRSTFAILNTMHPKWGQDFHFTVSTPTS